ncbi:MAG: peptidoglycan DD-metalloendopeptidase family protein [Bacteroidia bacterium]|nr:peptidoglycan DD-metalloendopeptidase family protein [Bacteroidia bacterium]
MDKNKRLEALLRAQRDFFLPVVPVNFQVEPFVVFDFSIENPNLITLDLEDIEATQAYIQERLEEAGARVGIGGYNEDRAVYGKSQVFHSPEGIRSIHLGMDIWMPANTPVFAPLSGIIHSFQDNDRFGDYGPTIILKHSVNDIPFYTLYGHLSRESLANREVGQKLAKGDQVGTLGDPSVNGHWTPHLHFQLITDMLGHQGDFVGVAPASKRAYYLQICPNPNLILNIPGLD